MATTTKTTTKKKAAAATAKDAETTRAVAAAETQVTEAGARKARAKGPKLAGTTVRVRVVMAVDVDYDRHVKATGGEPVSYLEIRGRVQDQARAGAEGVAAAHVVDQPTDRFSRDDGAYGSKV